MTTGIYELIADSDTFPNLEAPRHSDLDLFIDGFEGQPMAQGWPAPRVRLASEQSQQGMTAPDFASLFGAVPILSERAVKAVGTQLRDGGELLPLRCEDATYWAFNVLTTVDLLDKDRSQGDWFAPGRLMTLKKLVPVDSMSADVPPIFKLPEWLKGPALVTQPFIDAVETHDLTGLDARRVGEL